MTDRDLMRWRKTVDIPRVHALIAEHKREVGIKGVLLRMEYLTDELEAIGDWIFLRERQYERMMKDGTPYVNRAFLAKCIKDDETIAKRIRKDIYFLCEQGCVMLGKKPRSNSLTPEMIERAKEYLIENLVDVKRGMARCIAHEDKSPSMDCRNNFVFCHACGFHADAIGLYQRLYGVGFREAVEALQ